MSLNRKYQCLVVIVSLILLNQQKIWVLWDLQADNNNTVLISWLGSMFDRDIKASSFIGELERGKKTAHFLLQKVPHIIPHPEVSSLLLLFFLCHVVF